MMVVVVVVSFFFLLCVDFQFFYITKRSVCSCARTKRTYHAINIALCVVVVVAVDSFDPFAYVRFILPGSSFCVFFRIAIGNPMADAFIRNWFVSVLSYCFLVVVVVVFLHLCQYACTPYYQEINMA